MSTPTADLPTQPPLAVVGLSALFPKAASTGEFWSNIRRGVDAITEVPDTHWNPDDYFDPNQKAPDMTYARRGGFLSPIPFDPLEFGISPNNLEAIDTSQLLGMVGAKRALEHAGYGSDRTFDRSRVGCILGVTGTLEMVIPLGARLGHPRWRKALKDAGVSDEVAEDVVNRISQSYVPWQENSFPGLLGNVVAGRIANRLDLHGTNCVVDAACASSLSAIHLAALELWTGRSDMVVTGGIDTFNDIFMFMCFSKTPALSPSGDSKPFSDEADGTILGEGVGMLVLKRLADAQRDGDRIYAVLKGIGTSSDGAGNAVYAPKAEGQIRCLQDAYRVAGVSPDTIELVEAHGTGTKVGDATEVTGLMTVYKATGRRGAWCAVGSVKSQIGHTKAAAGAAGVIKAILALRHRVLPPTIKVNQPPAAMLADDSPFYVNTEARPWLKPRGYPRRAAVSAFGFGGSNFHCVLEESPQPFDEPDWDGDVQVIALSTPTLGQLAESIPATLGPLATAEWSVIRSAAASSLLAYRVDQTHRMLFVIERDKTDLPKLATGALMMLDRYADRENWSTPDGAYYGRGPCNGKLGVLFPGQGSQYVNMLRELTCRFPVMSSVLSDANDVFASATPVNGHSASTNRLSDHIFPRPAFAEETRSQQESLLRSTEIAQPAIGAISLAVLTVLDQFGVRPEAVAGHSYGELTALCASRRFAPQVLYRLSMLRGQLMAAAQEVDGGMLAVGAPLTQIETALKELSVDLVVANHNSPNQVVLSGRIPEIDRAASLLATRNIRGKKLSVAAAFHSPLVAPASRDFRPMLDEVDFSPSSVPVYANSTATEYPAEPQAARDLLATQLARPVHFVREVEQMYADGVSTFLEVGPGAVLTGLVNSILNGRDYRAVAIDSSSGKRNGMFDLASALAQLSAAGHDVAWRKWDPQDESSKSQGPSQRMRIPICGANYVKPRPPIPTRSSSVPLTAIPAMAADRTDKRSTIPHETAIDKPLNPPVETVKTESVMELPGTVAAVPSIFSAPSPAPEQTKSVHPPTSHRSTATPMNMNPPMKTSKPAAPEPERQIASARLNDSGTVDVIRQTLSALQKMQQETSRLHQQFLEGQEAALKTFARLADLQLDDRSQQSLSQKSPAKPFDPGSHLRRDLDSLPAPLSPSVEPPQWRPIASRSDVQSTTGVPAVTATPPLSEPRTSAVIAEHQPVVALRSITTSKQELAPSPVTAIAPAHAPHIAAPTPPPASPLAATVLAVVAEKTGYPAEMLNLGMSLDHDLGIDSIKRVEILSALQERVPHLPAFQPEELGALHTLQDVVSLADARTATTPRSLIEQKTLASTTKTQPSAPVVNQTTRPSLLGPIVLAVVSEKTGYPTEMLNLEMSLDHDLGIDSIKRVEILSALQERVPHLPAFQPDELGALHTLRDVVNLADARSTTGDDAMRSQSVVQDVASATAPLTTTSSSAVASLLGPTVLAVVAEKTGYPVEMLNLEMSLDHDLGIDSIKRVEILSALQERVPHLPAFQPEELGALHTLRDVVSLADARSATEPDAGSIRASESTSVVATTTPPSAHSSTPVSLLGPTVLEVVSEKTGYPVEMLNLDMSLDHDLGIDSIKRVEILSALQERVPHLPAFQPEELGALHTLRDVVQLADARSASPASPCCEPRCEQSIPLVSVDSVTRGTTSVSVSPTSVAVDSVSRSIVKPVAMTPASARPAINLLPGSDIWITEDGLGLSLQIAQELTNRGFRPRIIDLDESQVPTIPSSLCGLIIVAPQRGMSERQLWSAVEWLQKVGPQLRQTSASTPTIFATLSRLDGRFGFDGTRRLQDPISGGLAGIAKCVSREWPEIVSRAFDLGMDWTAAHVPAAMFVTELLHEGPVEVGLTPAGSFSLDVVEQSLNGAPDSPPIDPNDVVVVSGGARGVTAEAAFAVGRAWRPRLVILGRSPEPTPEPDWLADRKTEAEIKQALIGRAPAGTTPKAIATQVQQIVAGREVARQLQRLRLAGLSVVYHAVDVRDPTAVKPLLTQIRQNYGVIRGIIHGAGVLADQRIEDKTHEQFERVYQTKIQGLKSLLESVDPNELRMLGLFSSYTARFGRVGQLDYAIANEVLNKLARQFAILYPQCRVASFNWGPWDGGMVQGGLKQLFASEGVGLIPLEAGAAAVTHEFGQSISRPVEVLVLARQVASETPNERPRTATPQSSSPNGTTVGEKHVDSDSISSSNEFKLVFERVLDIADHPFLESHVLGGKAVLPVAMILEWLAHGAIHRNAGLELCGFEELRIYQGIRLASGDRLPLRILSGKPIRVDGRYKVPMRLVGIINGREVIHAAGTAVLCTDYPSAMIPTLPAATGSYSVDVSSAYSHRLFHGAQFRGITSIDGCSADGITVTTRSAPVASAWMLEPVRANWLADPLVVDAALQAIILWSQELRGKPCLPCAIKHYQQFCRVFPRNGLRIVVQMQNSADSLIRCNIEMIDSQGRLIARMEGCESVAESSLTAAFQKNQLDA